MFETAASTYCLVAKSSAFTGSCVTVTEVNPAGVNDVPPSAMFVVPSVIELFVRALLGMLVNVFNPASIVLLVSVSVVARPTNVSVAVGSVSVPVLTIVEIVGLVSVKPAIVAAVAPSDTDVDPIVTALLVNDELPILLKVFTEPLIVLSVSV